MKLISWNVNGLRSIYNKNILNSFFNTVDADVVCFQETKAREDQLVEDIKNIDGYRSFFSSHYTKKGYSGVATYSKIKPDHISTGIGIERFDNEGRILQLDFKDFILLNVYFPNGGMSDDRLKYKLDFYDSFLEYIEKLRKKGRGVVFCGDVNTAHKEIDLARPKQNENNTGFLPIEREWIDRVLDLGYVDTFRYFYPDKKDSYTYWDQKTYARDRNVGWRIDYFFVSSDMLPRIKGAGILPDITGSDHCPITLDFK